MQLQNSEVAKRIFVYARAVVSGTVIAGPHIREAAARHLHDLKHGAARGLRFDAEAAGRAIRFFPAALRVRSRDGRMVPFELLDWQAFIVGSIFGWKTTREEDGAEVRRFTEAYVETGKGSGKSPLAAGIGHYMFLADGEAEPEVYAAATKRDQAMILFRDAVSMVDHGAPKMRRRVVKSGRNPVWQLTDRKSRGFFKPISNDDGQSGPRPSCALVDEYHEHRNSDTLEMLKAGFKGRASPLALVITNSGSDVTSPCYELHAHAIKVAARLLEDDALFAFVCGMDEGDDPLKDDTCWIKGNPSLGTVVGPDYVRRAVLDATALTSRAPKVRRLYFCQWTDAPESWINRSAWEACEAPLRLEDYAGRPCFAGLDLSFTQDLSALALAFPRPANDAHGAGVDLFVEFWKPGDVIADHEYRDRVKYSLWRDQGFLHAPPGLVLKTAPIATRLSEVQTAFDLQCVAYDKYRLKDLEADLESLGLILPMMEHPQGFRRGTWPRDTPDAVKAAPYPLWMPDSVRLMETGVIERTLRVQPNPVLRWNVSAAVVREDPAGTDNRHLDKRRATGRIDGAVAACMALGAADAAAAPPEARGSYLETSDMVVLG